MKPKALRKLAQHPGLFDREALLAARDLYEFDNIFTAPLHGFRDTDDYWARASAKPHLQRIRIPALALNARNDPFVPAASLPAAQRGGRHVTLWQPAKAGTSAFRRAHGPATCGRCRRRWRRLWLRRAASLIRHQAAHRGVRAALNRGVTGADTLASKRPRSALRRRPPCGAAGSGRAGALALPAAARAGRRACGIAREAP